MTIVSVIPAVFQTRKKNSRGVQCIVVTNDTRKLRPPSLACRWYCFWQSWALRIDGGAATWTMLEVFDTGVGGVLVPRGRHYLLLRLSRYVEIWGRLGFDKLQTIRAL